MPKQSATEQVKRKGRSRPLLFLVAAVAFAGLVAFIVFGVIDRFRQRLDAATRPIPTAPAVVALEELPIGAEIQAEQVGLVNVAPELLPEAGTFDEVELVVGRTARERILVGEILREDRLASAVAGVGLNVLVTPGMRAMTVETDSQSGVGGFLRPGYKVDAIVTIRPDDNNLRAKWVTETILQDVKVLAVGDQLPGLEAEQQAARRRQSATMRRRNYVTLEVDVDQAERLALASARGDLHLALRSDIDLETFAGRGPLLTNEMVGLPKARRSVARKPQLETAEVIAGSKTVIEAFDETGKKLSETRRSR